jgi:integrase
VRAKRALDKRIAERRGSLQPHWTIHDLRRSFTTHINELGFAQPPVIEAILNHVSGHRASVVGVYNRATYMLEKCEASRSGVAI